LKCCHYCCDAFLRRSFAVAVKICHTIRLGLPVNAVDFTDLRAKQWGEKMLRGKPYAEQLQTGKSSE